MIQRQKEQRKTAPAGAVEASNGQGFEGACPTHALRGVRTVEGTLPATPEQAADAEMDLILAQKGFKISRHKVYNPGLPAGVLGKGNFGCVYKATRNGTAWAVKKIEKASAFGNLTQKEIEVLRLLNGHPNVVVLEDAIAYPSRDWMFLVMEFVESGDLLGALTKYPNLFEEPLVRAMMFHVSCGLAFAHEVGVMHRDIKPENILLCSNMVPKIADFGLARMVGTTEICQTMAGTPGYMAPEVMDVRVPYEFPADVYSMGLVFVDMLSETSCLEWAMAGRPAADKERFVKKWPPGTGPGKKTKALVALQRKAACQVPGDRITAFQLCKDLLDLEKEDPMPCKLWSVQTKMPAAPPAKRMVSPESAAEIAGRLGYAKGSPVLVYVDGQMHEGTVEHISTALCPGAAEVRYKVDRGEKTTLIPPWQFAARLRPAMREPLGMDRSRITWSGEDDRVVQSKSRRSTKLVPEANGKPRCTPAGCCVQ
jgi:predicted Ser/Thr protein kinase